MVRGGIPGRGIAALAGCAAAVGFKAGAAAAAPEYSRVGESLGFIRNRAGL